MRLDRIYDVRWTMLKDVTFGWITLFDRLTGNARPKPADLTAAAGVLLLLICERFQVEPREVLTAAGRMLRAAEVHAPQHVRAMREFLAKEMNDE
jgi:hypothetical protein